MDFDTAQRRLNEHMKTRGLKVTRQREVILRVFLAAQRHLPVEELLGLVRQVAPRTGHATVYRTMKLFVEAGVAAEHNFSEGATVYEPIHAVEEHHDHLICRTCGRIVEFENAEVEALQERIAKRLGFVLVDHRMELYGDCLDRTCDHRP